MAEQLALEQRLNDGRTVHRHEALRAAWSELVQRARDELLTRARIAADQRGADMRREPPNQPEHVLHGRPAPDHPAELEALREVALERQHFAPLRRFVARRWRAAAAGAAGRMAW